MAAALFVTLLIGVVSLLWFYARYHRNYWRRRNIPHNPPDLIMGNMTDWQKKKHISEIFVETYKKFKGTGPFAGFQFFIINGIIVLDLELVKNILIKDFQNFRDRGIFHNERDDPLTANLFFLDGDKWNRLRHTISPTFTSGKMKMMFSTVLKEGKELITVLEEKLATMDKNESAVEMVDYLARFTADVIGSCAFGLECNSLRNPNAEFVVMGRRFFLMPRHGKLIDGLINCFPKLSRRLRMRVIHQSVHDFYMRIVSDTIEYREKSNIKRKDFMDMMIDLKNGKPIKDENGQDIKGLTVEEVAAQSFAFFLAGFETSSTTMGFALYELAQHQDIQDKLRSEILTTLAKHNNEFTYECMKDMPYLDQVIDETLRLHPVAPHLVRRSNTRYETNDPKYYIEKDTLIIIPSIAYHHDADFFPEPKKFKPERFTAEEIQKRPACAWLPFGEGPRNCIGLRFGKMQAYIGLALLLKNFKFTVSVKTQIPYNMEKSNILVTSEGGIYLKLEKL